MPSPAGHMLAGLIIAAVPYRHNRLSLKRVAAGTIIAASPDLDILLVYCGVDYFTAHRTFSHSLITILVTFIILWGANYIWMLNHKLTRLPYLLVSSCLLSHIVLDLLGEDTYGPKGMMIMWPYSTSFYDLNINLFYSAFNSDGTVKSLSMLAWVGMWELIVIGLCGIVIILTARVYQERRKRLSQGVLLQ